MDVTLQATAVFDDAALENDDWYRNYVLTKKPARAWLENVLACAERRIAASLRERELTKRAIAALYPDAKAE